MEKKQVKARAMVFAAGLGTRLRPYTNDRPKALVEVGGMTLLEIQLRRLKAFGIREVVVNVHHFAELVEAELVRLKALELDIMVSDERAMLLETGGGLKRAADMLGRDLPILVANVDVLTDLDIYLLAEKLDASNALAVLAVRERETSRYLVWDDAMRLRGWLNKQTGEKRGIVLEGDVPLAFSGVQILQPAFLDLLRQEGKFSIIDTYLDLCKEHLIKGLRHDDDLWMDVGKPAQLELANALRLEQRLLI